MENNFDNFDDLVKKKLDGMDFSFNEANWQKASEMIDASRPTKKPFGGKFFIASSILIVGVLAVGTAYYFTSSLDVTKENLAQNINKTSVISQKTNSTDENYSTKSIANNSKNNSVSENTNETTNTSQTQETNSNLSITSAENKSGNNASVQNNSRNKNNLTAAVKNIKQQSAKGINNQVSKTSNNTAIPVGAIENAKDKTSNTNTGNSLNNSSNINNSNVLNSSNTTVESNNVLATNSIETKTSDSTQADNKSILKPEEENTTAKVDTASNIKKDNDYVKIKHHVLNVEAGVVNSFGWKVNGIRNGNNLSPLVGVNYIYNINTKSSILVGAQYNSISNLTESHVSFSVTSYNFGLNNDVTTYKLTNLQYLVIPVKYMYHIDENNTIGAGVNASYLVNIRNKIESNKSLESNVQETATNVDNGYGYEQVNRFNVQLAISYSRKISKKIGVNVEINRTMMNVIKDYNYFGSSNNGSKPISLKFGLTYNLINK